MKKVWKVYGPDLNGRFGGLQGTGGLEATIVDSGGATKGVINDQFGNGVASVSGSTLTWFATRVGGYGPLPGTAAETLTDIARVAEATAWRSRRIDPTGFYNLGARYYEPTSGRFLSADPRGHSASPSLYDFANGDPVNYFDPTGRIFGTPLSTGEFFGAVGSGLLTGAGNVGYSAVTAPYRMGQTVVSGYGQMGGLLGDVITGNSGIVDMASHPINTIQATGNVAVDTAVGMGKNIYQQAQTSEGLANLSTDLAMGVVLGGILPNTPPALRLEYEAKVAEIADTANELKAAGMDPESIAREVSADRRALGKVYKDMTPPDLLDTITQRNMDIFGDPLGPTVEWQLASGKTWDQIIESASRPGGGDINFGDTPLRNLTGATGTAAYIGDSALNGNRKCQN